MPNEPSEGINRNMWLLEVSCDAVPLVDVMLQNDPNAGGCGVAICRWEDYPLTDLRDLLKFATESLTRFLAEDPSVEVLHDDGPSIEKGDIPF